MGGVGGSSPDCCRSAAQRTQMPCDASRAASPARIVVLHQAQSTRTVSDTRSSLHLHRANRIGGSVGISRTGKHQGPKRDAVPFAVVASDGFGWPMALGLCGLGLFLLWAERRAFAGLIASPG